MGERTGTHGFIYFCGSIGGNYNGNRHDCAFYYYMDWAL